MLTIQRRITCLGPARHAWHFRFPVVLLLFGLVAGYQPRSVAIDRFAPGHSLEQEDPGTALPAVPVAVTVRARHEITRLGVDHWHQAGYRGQGIKIAILDSGFRGYRSHLGKELPEQVTAHTFRTDGDLEARDSQHGIICGEVIHKLAPDAELLFASWDPERPDRFLDAVRWARGMGAKVISCSLIMPSWSDGEGGGEIHAALSEILGRVTDNRSALCFASAGNIAQRHWSGVCRKGADGYHEWVKGEVNNVITPWGSERISAELYWASQADYDLTVVDADNGTLIGRSAPFQKERRYSAVVGFDPEPNHRYKVRVRQTRGEGGRFHLASLCSNLQYSTTGGSVAFPADGPEVIAVGAVDDEGRREDYSSCGPNSSQLKPEIVAPVPFAIAMRTRPFSGTSAAAPQAAALAALWWSRHPAWSASQVRASMLESANDLGPRGHDWETGYGCIRLP
jgi:subtilisin family serine protease